MKMQGTQRRLAVTVVAVTALSPVALFVRPASAFPPGDPVSTFDYHVIASTHLAKLKETISPAAGTFKGSIDRKTGQLKGVMALPPVTFADPAAGLATATAAFTQVKPVTGHLNRSYSRITATSKFVLHIVTASTSSAPQARHTSSIRPADVTVPSLSLPVTLPSLPTTLPSLPVTLPSLPTTLPSLPVTLPSLPTTLPSLPVNMVGSSCYTAPITMTLQGITRAGTLSKLIGTFTIPTFSTCGALTTLLNTLFPGPGNTFSATATPISAPPTTPTLPCTLPTLPITLPSLPVSLTSLPVTLPSLPVSLPSVPCTLPGVTLPALNP
jgi:hypothetical protein